MAASRHDFVVLDDEDEDFQILPVQSVSSEMDSFVIKKPSKKRTDDLVIVEGDKSSPARVIKKTIGRPSKKVFAIAHTVGDDALSSESSLSSSFSRVGEKITANRSHGGAPSVTSHRMEDNDDLLLESTFSKFRSSTLVNPSASSTVSDVPAVFPKPSSVPVIDSERFEDTHSVDSASEKAALSSSHSIPKSGHNISKRGHSVPLDIDDISLNTSPKKNKSQPASPQKESNAGTVVHVDSVDVGDSARQPYTSVLFDDDGYDGNAHFDNDVAELYNGDSYGGEERRNTSATDDHLLGSNNKDDDDDGDDDSTLSRYSLSSSTSSLSSTVSLCEEIATATAVDAVFRTGARGAPVAREAEARQATVAKGARAAKASKAAPARRAKTKSSRKTKADCLNEIQCHLGESLRRTLDAPMQKCNINYAFRADAPPVRVPGAASAASPLQEGLVEWFRGVIPQRGEILASQASQYSSSVPLSNSPTPLDDDNDIGNYVDGYGVGPASRWEKVSLYVVPGALFLKHSRGNTLLAYFFALRESKKDNRIVYLVEGLLAALHQEVLESRRHFRSAINSATSSEALSSSLRIPFDRTRAFVSLELAGFCIAETQTPLETAEFVALMTASVAELPYKQAPLFTSFSAHAVKANRVKGFTPWGNMLVQIRGVSSHVAAAIVQRFPTFISLWRFLTNKDYTRDHKIGTLANIQVSSEKKGQRSLGVALAHRLYVVFTCKDGRTLVP